MNTAMSATTTPMRSSNRRVWYRSEVYMNCMNYKPKIILGIDPGTAIIGFGLVESAGQALNMVACGCITNPKNTEQTQRLLHIYKELKKIIKKYKPDVMAVEQLFFFKNVKTALTVAEARGVVVLAGAQANLPLYECTPLQVKQAVSAYGQASKLQVQKMVKLLLRLNEIPRPDDAADALAVAICGAHTL